MLYTVTPFQSTWHRHQYPIFLKIRSRLVSDTGLTRLRISIVPFCATLEVTPTSYKGQYSLSIHPTPKCFPLIITRRQPRQCENLDAALQHFGRGQRNRCRRDGLSGRRYGRTRDLTRRSTAPARRLNLAYRACGFVAVHDGHGDVHEDDIPVVWVGLLKEVDAGLAVVRFSPFVALLGSALLRGDHSAGRT